MGLRLQGIAKRVADAAERLKSELVRKSDPGVVMRADGRVEIMRWGFHRNFNPSINNARSDKLEAGMWAEAFHDRRCVIPMSLFYEWGPGVAGRGGRKQAHEFHDPDDDCLWVAGIWEESPELGPCYSMVTTAVITADGTDPRPHASTAAARRDGGVSGRQGALGFPAVCRAAGSDAV